MYIKYVNFLYNYTRYWECALILKDFQEVASTLSHWAILLLPSCLKHYHVVLVFILPKNNNFIVFFLVLNISNFMPTKRNLLFCFYLRKSATESQRMLSKAYDDYTPSISIGEYWFRCYKRVILT